MPAPSLITIQRFQQRAESLQEQGLNQGLGDSIVDLARWMDAAFLRLNEQDRAVLLDIGGHLVHESMRLRPVR